MCDQKPEALFINATAHTRQHMQRVYQAAMPGWLVGAMGGLCALCLALFALPVLIGGEGSLSPSAILCLVYLALMTGYVFFLRNWLGARRYERVNREMHPGKIPGVTWHFYEEYAQAQSVFSENAERVEYENIIRVKETKTDLLLFRKMKRFYHLDKAGIQI